MARHIARAIDYAISSHVLHKTFKGQGADGDEFDEPNLEMRYDEEELVANMQSWSSIDLSHIEPSDAAMKQVKARKRAEELENIPADCPEEGGEA